MTKPAVTPDDPYTIECPHCHGEWVVDPDDNIRYANHHDPPEVCDDCGGRYQLTTREEVFFTATPPDEPDQ